MPPTDPSPVAHAPEHEYHALLNLIRRTPFGMYLIDADFRLVEISAGCAHAFAGIDPLIGRDFSEVLRIVWPEPFASDALARFRHTLDTGEPYHCPDTAERRGNVAIVESYDWHLQRLTMPDGRHGVVCHFYETTRLREEQRRALAQSASRAELAKEATGVGFWFCDLPFDTLIWDGQVKEHFWLPADALVTIDTFYAHLHPDDRERTRAAIEASIANHTRYDIEYRTRSVAGQVKWIRAIGRTFYNAAGQPIRFDGVTLDITEHKLAEDALRENDRRKDEFLAMLAHELRNPLAPIRHAAQVLKLVGPAEPSQQWARDVIERQTQHLTRLVDDLLDVSRITQRKITLQREPLHLATIVERAIEANRPLADARRQRLAVTLPREPISVEGDLTRLIQVMSNLVNNAVKYTQEGGEIAIAAAADGGSAIVRVRDNGMGIAADLLPSIFDLFRQADQSLDRSQGGLGIGLTLVRLLIEMHGGRVEAHSAGPGRGSEFVVRLPRLEAGDPAAIDPALVSRDADGRRPRRILIVEDNKDSAEMLRFLLSLQGHELRVAEDGVAALEAARLFQPHVILCDLGLPQMNGYQVARHLRAQPEFQQTRLIALSGYGQDSDRLRAKEAGFDYHLVKPVEPDTLTALLDSLKDEPLLNSTPPASSA